MRLLTLSFLLLALPGIAQQPAADTVKKLQAVTVTARKPLIEHQIDRSVVNVGSMLSSGSSNSLEILDKIPGVQVGINGEINLNGRQGVMVMIDGRTNYLSGNDLVSYLKSLPGSVIDKIELIDNPSARYDANGNAIINIKLKKNRLAGFTGNLNLGFSQGQYARDNESLGINYRRGAVNIFSNLSYGTDRDYTQVNATRYFYDEQMIETSRMAIDNRQQNRQPSLNALLGMDWQVNKKLVTGWQLTAGGSERVNNMYNINQLYAPGEKPLSTNRTVGNVKDDRRRFGANLNAQYQLNDKGSELLADVNYQQYRNEGNQEFTNRLYDESGDSLRTDNYWYTVPGSLAIWTARIDYSLPLSRKRKLEAGYKSGFVRNDQETQTNFHNNSNHFLYDENVHALYGNWQQGWKRWGWQAGLRLEYTRTLGRQLVTATDTRRNYTQLFPSFFLQYKLDSLGKNILSMAINRRINRPNYGFLNPFVFYQDEYSYSLGNPYLQPQFQLRYELKYQRGQWLNMGLSYNRFTQLIFNITTNDSSVYKTQPQNVSNGFMLLLNTSINLNPFKWWSMNHYIQTSRLGLNGNSDGEPLQPRAWVLRYTLNNQFTITKSWSAEAGGYYASRDLNGQAYTRGRVRAQAGLQKKWKDGKLALRLSANDIFHTWVDRNNSTGIRQSFFTQQTESDTQRFGISFGYRFGKENLLRKRKYNNSNNDEERNRVND